MFFYLVWKLKPLNQEILKSSLESYDYIVTIEEQTLDGGFGSIISEFICDNQLPHKLLRLGLPEKFIFETGMTKITRCFYHRFTARR